MSKHTPGPWRASNDNALDKWEVYPPYNHVNARLPVLNVPGQEEANARLIAAAPEMLDALREAADSLLAYDGLASSPDDRDGWSDPDAFAAYQRARALLARIDGDGEG